jgi:hypothetical protein
METRVQRKIEEMWLLFESAEEIHRKLRPVAMIWKSFHKGQGRMSELADMRTEMMNKIIEGRSREWQERFATRFVTEATGNG